VDLEIKNYHVEEVHLVRKESSHSERSDSEDVSQGGDSVSSGSVYLVESTKKKNDGESDITASKRQPSDGTDVKKDGKSYDVTGEAGVGEGESADKKKLTRLLGKKKGGDDDRRRNSWVPCTCPQYKVSNQLASRKDVQGVFFAKVIAIKVLQLMIINIIIFGCGFLREATIDFFKTSHDYAYLAYFLFLAILLSLRVVLGYRARWPKWAAFIVMIPLTIIIAFTSACITVVYNSVLIPMVTCTIFLAFVMLCFTPYLLRKQVMEATTNCAAAFLALLSSIILIFLKELEAKPITYWEFVSQVWLPGLLLSQIVVQITVFEIQRMLFGLCFNVSSTRWHIAALYL